MNSFVVHVASGHAFFSGAALLVVGLLVVGLLSRTGDASRPRHRLAALAVALGSLFVAISGTPLPVLAWVLAAGLSVAVLGAGFISSMRPVVRRALTATAAAVWIALIAFELPWHVVPRWPRCADGTDVASLPLFVIGDSVSAGMGDPGELNWPAMLNETGEVDVRDHSHIGATARTALPQAQRIEGPGRVLIEIGGNDLLGGGGGTPADAFERDLDELLQACRGPNRSLVMLELPLPPFCNRYGEVQRRLALRHGVALIPKRRLMSVFAAEGATLDGIHLSKSGHRLFADLVRELLARAPRPPRP